MAEPSGRPIGYAAGLLVASPAPAVVRLWPTPHAGYFGCFAAKVRPGVRILDTGGAGLPDRLDQARGAAPTAPLAVGTRLVLDPHTRGA